MSTIPPFLRYALIALFVGRVGFAIVIDSAALAQETSTQRDAAGAASVSSQEMTGEVVLVNGNTLVVKMRPTGTHRTFQVPAERRFIIDGQSKTVGELRPGTVLTATITTTTQPITVRTTTVTNGTVRYVAGNYVLLTLANGENKGYTVPQNFTFTTEGRTTTVNDLRPGMKVSGTRVVEDPHTEISTQTTVTGQAPK